MPASSAAAPSPFKFLDAYQKEDAKAFFGRDREVRELFERIYLSNIILLYGASGTGKSSLIRCGLANQFGENDWLPIFVRRDGRMLSSLHRALERRALSPMPPGLSLEEKIHNLYLDYFLPIYLVFDQFEELFIQGDEHEQGAFFDALSHLLGTIDRCTILISMREEYLAHLSDFEMVIPNLFANRQRLEPMSLPQLRDVIRGNARLFGIDLEADVQTADLIIEQLRNKKGEVELPYLQIYLDRLYQRAKKRQTETGAPLRFDSAIIRQTRQLEDVLSDFLSEQIEALEADLQSEGLDKKGLPLAVLFALVTSDRTRKSNTVSQVREEISKRFQVDTMYVDYCLQQLLQKRILTFKE